MKFQSSQRNTQIRKKNTASFLNNLHYRVCAAVIRSEECSMLLYPRSISDSDNSGVCCRVLLHVRASDKVRASKRNMTVNIIQVSFSNLLSLLSTNLCNTETHPRTASSSTRLAYFLLSSAMSAVSGGMPKLDGWMPMVS